MMKNPPTDGHGRFDSFRSTNPAGYKPIANRNTSGVVPVNGSKYGVPAPPSGRYGAFKNKGK